MTVLQGVGGSSRPLRTGSIAAGCDRRGSATAPEVVPSSPDGLHCGADVLDLESIVENGRPVLSGRAPLRRRGVRKAGRTGSGRPVLSGRAPLRPVPAGGHRRAGRRSSRPLRTGSIAAACRRSRRTPLARRPVLSGRAPLRPGDRFPGPAEDEVVPSSPDGLHCGRLREMWSPTAYRVVPSSPDGLHCGLHQIDTDAATEFLSSRPLRTGSIAATCSLGASRRARTSSRPLRTGSIAARRSLRGPGWPHPVVPSSPDGLHCGLLCPTDFVGRSGVVPSSPDGLHCGASVAYAFTGTVRGRPVLSGRAPLRRHTPYLGHAVHDESSRPLRTGSIAAPC